MITFLWHGKLACKKPDFSLCRKKSWDEWVTGLKTKLLKIIKEFVSGVTNSLMDIVPYAKDIFESRACIRYD